MRLAVVTFVGLLFVLLTQIGSCEEGWRDQARRTIEDTAARKSKDGFGGWVVVTSDADWQTKWHSSPETVPRFTEAKTLKRGQSVFVLIFFSNPLIVGGMANVTCDIDVTRPDGSVSIHQPDAACFAGLLQEDPRHVFLSAPIIRFVGEPHDPAGEWVVEVTLKDNARDVALPLKTSFNLGE
jgi:hypothetical protein